MGDPIGSYSRPVETWCLADFRGLSPSQLVLSSVSESPTTHEGNWSGAKFPPRPVDREPDQQYEEANRRRNRVPIQRV